jgi:hypothetical protein
MYTSCVHLTEITLRKYLSMKKLLFLAILLVIPALSMAAPTANTQYFQDDGSIIVHLDLQRLQQGQTPKKLLGMMMTNPSIKARLNDFKERFGVDPFKDISSASFLVKMTQRGVEPEVLMHVQGQFDQAKVVAGLNASGSALKAEQVGTQTLHVSEANNSAIAFVSGALLMGTPDRLRKALQGVKFGGELAAQQAKLTSDSVDLWFAVALPEAMRQDMKASNPAMADSKTMRGTLDFSEGLILHLVTEFVAADVATRTAEQVKAAVAQVGQTPQGAMFGSMLTKLTVTTNKEEMTLHLPLSQAEMDQIQAVAQMLMMSMAMQQPAPAQPSPTPAAPSFPKLAAPAAPAAQPAPAPAPAP